MPTYFGYLRVSRDSQDVASQRLGLLDYANTHGYSPLVLVDETVSRDQSWRKRAIGERNGFSYQVVSGQQPIELIGSAAEGIGHLNQLQDVDGAVRQEPLLVNYYGDAVPSMALLAALKSLNLVGPDK